MISSGAHLDARTPTGGYYAYPHNPTDVIAGSSWSPTVLIGSGWNVCTFLH